MSFQTLDPTFSVSEEPFVKGTTHVIDNSGDEATLEGRVGEVWDDLLRLTVEG